MFVIDARDDYIDALMKLNKTILKAFQVNKAIKFEVFIHKVDGISDDLKMETQRDIHQRATDDLADAGYDRIHLSFHLTSIYDHSIFEAFSKVVQKLIPQLPKLENLLNIFITVRIHILRMGICVGWFIKCLYIFVYLLYRILASKKPSSSTWCPKFTSQPTVLRSICRAMSFVAI